MPAANRAWHRGLLVCTALFGVVLIANDAVAQSTGGRGGDGNYDSIGGAGQTFGVAGASGTDSAYYRGGGGGGGAGAVGGKGGSNTGAAGAAGVDGDAGNAVGGNGGVGGNANYGGGGGGGGGGNGIRATAGGTLAISGATGGNGGNGGTTFYNNHGAGGGGGSGGYGAGLTGGAATLNVSGALQGGNGGAGGTGYGDLNAGGSSGGGGDGGGGVYFGSMGSSLNLLSGAVVGGTGGNGGIGGHRNGASGRGGNGVDFIGAANNAVFAAAGTAIRGGNGGFGAAGGAGIVGSGIAIVNDGTIAGGYANLGGPGAVQADAIVFIGGSNSLTLGNAGAIEGNIGITGTLSIDPVAAVGDSITLGNVIHDATSAGSLIKSGAGRLVLTGNNTYTGSTILAAGILNAGSAGALGTSGTLSFTGGTLQYSDFNKIDYSNRFASAAGQTYKVDTNGQDVIWAADLASSGGSLTKLGAGTLTLSGNNSYTGGTALAAGTLIAGSVGALGTSGTLSFTGGTLQYSASNQIDYSNRFSTAAGQQFSVDTNGQNVTWATSVASSGGSLAKLGAGTLTLGGNNSFTGGLILAGGTLTAGSTGALGASGTLTFTGGTLQYSAANQEDYSNRFSTAAGQQYSVDTNGQDIRWATGLTSVGGSLTKLGAGTLTLGGNNSFTNGLILAGGTLSAESTGALGTSGAITFTGGTLQYGAANQEDYSNRFSAAAGQQYSVDTSGQDVTWATDLAPVGGSLTKFGSGMLTLGGKAGYTGNTVVAGGTLKFADDARLDGSIAVAGGSGVAFDTPGTVSVDGGVDLDDMSALSIKAGGGQPSLKTGGLRIGADTSFNLSGISDQSRANQVLIDSASVIQGDFATISVGGYSGVVDYLTVNTRKSTDGKQYLASYDLSWTANNNLAHGTFTLAEAANSFAIGADLTDRAANPAAGWDGKSLTKTGEGTLIVTGHNTYSGGTTISAGTLQVGGGGSEGSIAGDIVNDGTLAFYRSDTLAMGGTISGSGKLRQLGAGTVVLTGTNSYRGGTDIDAGTLTVSADTNLGDLSGGLAFFGGTLSTTGSFDTARAVKLGTSGRFEVAANTALGLSGKVLGRGDLIKTGTGTLKLTNSGNAYGNTIVEAGSLVGDASTISGRIGNAATVVFEQTKDGFFAGEIAALGDARGIMIKRGDGGLTLTGASALDWTIEAGRLSTAASRFAGNVTIGSSASAIFDEHANARYAGTIAGEGRFTKSGSGALSLTGDSSGFVGSTVIANGSLSVDGSLGGSIDVMAGARLQGKGIIGRLSVGEGSTIAPGNSIGTLNVAGDVTLAAGSTYEVEIAGNGTSDRIAATGKATLSGGQVAVTALDAQTSYQAGQTYTILTAAGGVTGGFDPAVLSRSAFLDASLLQSANAVDLKIAIKGSEEPGGKPVFVKVADTYNRKQTAGALDTLQQSGQSLALYNKLLPLSADEPRAAFDGLSGEVNASTVTGLLEDSRFVREAMNDRLRSAFETVGAVPLMGYGDDAKELITAAVPSERYGAWGSVFGSWGRFDSDGNAAKLSRSVGGFVTGIDGSIVDDIRLGFLAGYSHSSLKVDDRRSSASTDNYHLGIYGGTEWGALAFRSGLAYTWSEIDSGRQISFPGFTDSLTGDYRAGTTQIFGELGYGIKAGSIALEPFANLAYVNVHTNGFTEQGGASALTVESGSNDVTFTTLGIRASTDFDLGTIKATARGMIGWRHGFGDITPTVSQAFTGSSVFQIAGAPIAKDAAMLEAGLDFAIAPRATLGVSYQGQLGSGASDHGVRADFSVKF